MRLWARAGHSRTNQEQDTPGYEDEDEEHVLAMHLVALRDADTYIRYGSAQLRICMA
jgi:hypothetical protein